MLEERMIANYTSFIESLKKLKAEGATTRDILMVLYLYYRDYVSYDYDLLQLVKMTEGDSSSPSYKCFKTYDEIKRGINDLNKKMKKNGTLITRELIQDAIDNRIIFSKEEAIAKLDEVFLELEGRPLTDKNKKGLFNDYYNIVNCPYKPAKEHGIFRHPEELEHSYMKGIARIGPSELWYNPVYREEMLINSTCGIYSGFNDRIFTDLKMKHKTLAGIGTATHGWSMVYLSEEEKWVHFDMTMVRFYLDYWIKDHEPYKPENWICASTEEIFKMQPTRKITSVGRQKCYIDGNNQEKLMEILDEEIDK